MKDWILVGVLGCGLALVSPADAKNACRDLPERTTDAMAAPGPHAVGQRNFVYVDASRPTPPNGDFPGAPDRTLVTEVWYPATTAGVDAPLDPSAGPYPVVIYSHGFLSSRFGASYLTQHLASHGYIVAAADYPLSNGGAPGGATVADIASQPGDWSFVLDQVLAEFGADADPEHIGATGLSLGGLTTFLVTYHADLRDPRVDAAAPMAGPACMFKQSFYQTSNAPLLVVFGDSDQLVPYRRNGRRSFRLAGKPKFLVRLEDGSHTGFSSFATLFDPSVHFDQIGCDAISVGLTPDQTDPNSSAFAEIDTPGAGVNLALRLCPLPCEQPVPTTPSMGATRQHTLTKAAVRAFFDAYLRGDDSARCFLRRPFHKQNKDIRVRARGANKPVLP